MFEEARHPAPSRAVAMLDARSLTNPRLFRNDRAPPLNNTGDPGAAPAGMLDDAAPDTGDKPGAIWLLDRPVLNPAGGGNGWTGRFMMSWRRATRRSRRPP